MAIQWLTGYPNMSYIPGGEFEMGDHFEEGRFDERPVHTVLLDSFFMSKFLITNEQYCDYLNDANSLGQIKIINGVVYASSDDSNDCPYCSTSSAPAGLPEWGDTSQIDYSDGVFSVRTKAGRDMSDDPMVVVSWYGAAAYCNWRSTQEEYETCYNLSTWECDFSKHGYRLSTEAEWEYAARGGNHSPYYRFPWGDTISHSQANYLADPCSYTYDVSPTEGFHPDWNDGGWPHTSPVDNFPPNDFCLYDMAGNVWEWCNDWLSETYYTTTPYPHVNPKGPTSGTQRILRGGGWGIYAYQCRVANRNFWSPGHRNSYYGFRIVLSD